MDTLYSVPSAAMKYTPSSGRSGYIFSRLPEMSRTPPTLSVGQPANTVLDSSDNWTGDRSLHLRHLHLAGFFAYIFAEIHSIIHFMARRIVNVGNAVEFSRNSGVGVNQSRIEAVTFFHDISVFFLIGMDGGKHVGTRQRSAALHDTVNNLFIGI
jgi:hypothetical protein